MKTTEDRHLTLLVQEALKSRGHDPGQLDGLWGGRTEKAWLAFRGTYVFPPAPKPGPVMIEPGEPAWLRVARGELGVDEIYGECDNPRIVEYHQSCTLRATDDETAWCSSFVNWCLAQCGIAGTRSAMARSFLAWGQPIHPRLGAIIVLKRGAAPKGHVGFYVGGDHLTLRLLGGNQGDKVSVRDFPWRDMLDSRWSAGVPTA